MSELIRKPRAKVDRRLVQAAVLRLARYPESTSMGTVMRLVDEYAASQHTELVHRHAERIVAEALVEAAAVGEGEKILVCDSVETHEKIFEEKFLSGKKIFVGKKIFKSGSICVCAGADTREKPANPTSLISPDCLNSPTCPTCATCLTCPICPVTDVTDMSGGTTAVPDTSGSVTGDTDKDGLATVERDKGRLATRVTDTADSGTVERVPTSCAQPSDGPTDGAPEDDASTVRAPVQSPKVDMSSCEAGKNDPEGSAPDAPDATGGEDGRPAGKRCTQCGEWREMSGYGRNRSRPDGHSSACRVCENTRDERRREARRTAKEAQNGA